MPIGQGYWIDSKTREWLEIYEHFAAIEKDPETYGFEPGELAVMIDEADSREQAREAVLTLVMQRGWIRVRTTRGCKVMEFWRQSGDIFGAIGAFLTGTGAWDNEQISMSEVATDHVWSEKAGALKRGEVVAANAPETEEEGEGEE